MKTEYKIVLNDDVFKLEKSVQCYLEDGWVCQGGVFIREKFNASGNVYYQAIVR